MRAGMQMLKRADDRWVFLAAELISHHVLHLLVGE